MCSVDISGSSVSAYFVCHSKLNIKLLLMLARTNFQSNKQQQTTHPNFLIAQLQSSQL